MKRLPSFCKKKTLINKFVLFCLVKYGGRLTFAPIIVSWSTDPIDMGQSGLKSLAIDSSRTSPPSVPITSMTDTEQMASPTNNLDSLATRLVTR